MEWLASNWIWIALVIGFIALHRFGHGGHGFGGHGHHTRRSERRDPELSQAGAELPAGTGPTARAANDVANIQEERKRHRHGC